MTYCTPSPGSGRILRRGTAIVQVCAVIIHGTLCVVAGNLETEDALAIASILIPAAIASINKRKVKKC